MHTNGLECKGRLTLSEWDNDDNEEEEPRGTSEVITVTLTPSPQQYKAYKSPYFNEMLNKPSPRVTTIKQRMWDIITAQEELSQTIQSIPQQILIEYVEWA